MLGAVFTTIQTAAKTMSPSDNEEEDRSYFDSVFASSSLDSFSLLKKLSSQVQAWNLPNVFTSKPINFDIFGAKLSKSTLSQLIKKHFF